MTDKTNSNIIEEIIDIIDNLKLPIKQKIKILKSKLTTISEIFNIFTDNESNKKKRKIKILIKNISNIKTNAELRKIFNLNLLYNLLSYNDNISSNKKNKLIDINDDKNYDNDTEDNTSKNEYNTSKCEYNTSKCEYNTSKNEYNTSKNEYNTSDDDNNEDDNNESDDSEDEDSKVDKDSEDYDDSEGDDSEDDEDTDSEDDEDTDVEESDNSNTLQDSLLSSNDINYLINDLPDNKKINLVLKITKHKNEHRYAMQLEMNRHNESMYDKKIKEIKLQNKLLKNKYQYKLELMKEKNRYNK
jgi:hypothetical protein